MYFGTGDASFRVIDSHLTPSLLVGKRGWSLGVPEHGSSEHPRHLKHMAIGCRQRPRVARRSKGLDGTLVVCPALTAVAYPNLIRFDLK